MNSASSIDSSTSGDIDSSITEPDVQCGCQMRECKCKEHEIRTTKESPLPRLVDKWFPPNNKMIKRKSASPFGVIATIDLQTTDTTLAFILKSDVRILHIELWYGTRAELERVMLKVTTSIQNSYLKSGAIRSPIAVAMEIRGRVVRVGRMRNNEEVKLIKKRKIMLTSNKAFSQCSTNEMIYFSNLEPYFAVLQVGDYIFINKHKIQLVVVKITRVFHTITCCILRGSVLRSYMEVTLPFIIETDMKLTDEEIEDCKFAIAYDADFIIIPTVANHKYLQSVRLLLEQQKSAQIPMLLGSLNLSAFENLESLNFVLQEIDGIWIDNQYTDKWDYEQYAILKTRDQFKPVIHNNPLKAERQKNIEKKEVTTNAENEKFLLTELDCVLFKRFNIYLKKQMEHKIKESVKAPKTMNDPILKGITNDILHSNQPVPIVIDSSILTSLILDGHLIIVVTVTGEIAVQLSHQRPRCQIISVLPKEKMDIARKLLLWRNVLPVTYDTETNKQWQTDITNKLHYGLNYAKQMGLVAIGDLVIYCYDSQANELTKSEQPNVYQAKYIAEEYITT